MQKSNLILSSVSLVCFSLVVTWKTAAAAACGACGAFGAFLVAIRPWNRLLFGHNFFLEKFATEKLRKEVPKSDHFIMIYFIRLVT